MPLDIGVGILLSLLVAHWFDTPASAWFIAFGIASALLPDIDIAPWFSRTAYDHRSFLHYPAIYIPIAALVWLVLGNLYGVLFALAILAHFIHDTIGIGWGVAWGWPFSRRKFLFPEKGRRRNHGFFMTWLPEEESALAGQYHDPHWVRHYYIRPNVIGYTEYAVLIFSILALLYWKL